MKEMILHDVFTLPSSEQRHTGAIICMLQKILATSRRLEDSLWIASGTKRADIHVRGSTENPHRRLARLLRKIVKSMAFAVAQPALSCFPLRDVYGSRMVHHANTICWFVVSTHPDPSSIFMYSIRLWGLVLVDHVCPGLPARIPWLQGVSGA